MTKYKKLVLKIISVVSIVVLFVFIGRQIYLSKSKNTSIRVINDFQNDNLNYLAEGQISEDNIFEVREKTATLLYPDENWYDEFRKKYGEDAEAGIDDGDYYIYLTNEFLITKKEEVKLLYPNQRYIKFVKENGTSIIIDKKKVHQGAWSVFFFDGKQDPYNASIANIQPEYEKYFNTN